MGERVSLDSHVGHVGERMLHAMRDILAEQYEHETYVSDLLLTYFDEFAVEGLEKGWLSRDEWNSHETFRWLCVAKNEGRE